MTKIILHLGAHKTATTHIQNLLESNLITLRQNSINYIPLHEIRPQTTRLLREKDKFPEIEQFIAHHAAGYEYLILSEENYMGLVKDVLFTGILYPYADERLRVLTKAISKFDVEVYFCLRNPATFIPSLYCEFLRHNNFTNFDQFRANFNFESLSWIPTIQILENYFSRKKIYLCTFEKISSNQKTFIEQISKVSYDSLVTLNTKSTRPSQSGSAIEIMRILSLHLKPKKVNKLKPLIELLLPKGKIHKAFQPLSAQDLLQLHNGYIKDREILSTKFQFIE